MINEQIQQKLNLPSEEQKQKLLKYLTQLVSKSKKDSTKKAEGKLRAYGALKGKINMAPDFDEPIEEFFYPH